MNTFSRSHLELLRQLTARELRIRYRGSYFGWMWVLARPLSMLLIYGLIVGVVLGANQSIPDFLIFIYVGIIAWTLFTAIVTGSISVITSYGSLLSKVRFPTILLPLANLLSCLVDFGVQALVLVGVFIVIGDFPSPEALLFLVPSLLGLVALGLALGLFLGAVNVYAKDVGYLTEIALQVGFWLCPILYSYGFIERAAEQNGLSVATVTRVYMLNPMANLILGFQRSLWPPAATPDAGEFAFPGQLGLRLIVVALVAVLMLVLAVLYFNRRSRDFAEVL